MSKTCTGGPKLLAAGRGQISRYALVTAIFMNKRIFVKILISMAQMCCCADDDDDDGWWWYELKICDGLADEQKSCKGHIQEQ
jgi:hypothetical protein